MRQTPSDTIATPRAAGPAATRAPRRLPRLWREGALTLAASAMVFSCILGIGPFGKPAERPAAIALAR